MNLLRGQTVCFIHLAVMDSVQHFRGLVPCRVIQIVEKESVEIICWQCCCCWSCVCVESFLIQSERMRFVPFATCVSDEEGRRPSSAAFVLVQK